MSGSLCTCEVSQAQLLKAMLPFLLVVDHHSQGILILIQRGASDDTQVVQWQVAELVESNKDVACHLFDSLRGGKKMCKVEKNADFRKSFFFSCSECYQGCNSGAEVCLLVELVTMTAVAQLEQKTGVKNELILDLRHIHYRNR